MIAATGTPKEFQREWRCWLLEGFIVFPWNFLLIFPRENERSSWMWRLVLWGEAVIFLKVALFLKDQRQYLTYRRMVPMSLLVGGSHPAKRKFQVAGIDQLEGGTSRALWRIQFQVDWAKLHAENKWGVDSPAEWQRMHLEARKIPNHWRCTWVGVF